MDLMELFFVCLGAAVVVFYGVKMVRFAKMLYPRVCFPQPDSFFTSMGEWAVVTGGSDGIGKAYAFELAGRGLNVVILSRTKDKLDRVALEIGETTGQKVKVVVADFTEDDMYEHIEENLKGLNISVLVNNVGILPSHIPCKFLQTKDLEQRITKVINCNVKALVKMCQIVLPGMEKRGKGVIVNISSGVATVPSPMYTMYCASKVFVERFSQGLQAEYKAKRVMIQAVAPFGVSTPMTGYQKSNMVTLTAEDFVRTSLEYLQAGDKTYGSICHTVLGWMVQAVPQQILHSETMQDSLLEYVKKRVGT
ncbi:17-beta-hydroxysteroid dehydrogenase type 3 isoform X1 [Oncorhynchus keta]|uniref:17-beta-hydroxysteroid dehydrogenase type 3 isoform X1 n=1 Tax=Oncorhynchus keta TaxID=8018 RepID=UPI00227A61A5|nr:17-beta-hydroxysteroid dehydrogenase type 3 isoform X1 [Oncorhynchus keta]